MIHPPRPSPKVLALASLLLGPSAALGEEPPPRTTGPENGTLVISGGGSKQFTAIFGKFVELAGGTPVHRPSASERAELVERHLELMVRFFPDERSTVHMLKKYLCAYASGLPGASDFRDRVNRSSEMQSVLEDALHFFRAAA